MAANDQGKTSKIYFVLVQTEVQSPFNPDFGPVWIHFKREKGQIGYVPGNYLQERLGRNSSLAHRYCEVGLNQLITESTTRVPTSENRALIKKISDLKKRIQRWSLDGDSSLSESELKPRLAPPQRTGKSF